MLEEFAEDIKCVMDAVDSESAVIYAEGDAGPLGLLFAATHPELVRGLVLYNTSARFLVDDDYEFGIPVEIADGYAEMISQDWGTGEELALYVPSKAHDPDFQRWMGRLMRSVTTPKSVKRYIDGVIVADARSILGSIETPTLILHPKESEVPTIEYGRYLNWTVMGTPTPSSSTQMRSWPHSDSS